MRIFGTCCPPPLHLHDSALYGHNHDGAMFSYDAAQKEHGKLIYNDVSMLLVLVIADNALFGITSVEDLQEMEISPGQDEQILHFNEKALDEYILKKCTKAEGVIDAPMPKSAFLAIFQGRSK